MGFSKFHQTLFLLLVLLSGYSQCAEYVGNREVKHMPVPQNWYTIYEILPREWNSWLSTMRNNTRKLKLQETTTHPVLESGLQLLIWNTSFVWMNAGNQVSYEAFPPALPDYAGGYENCLEINWRLNDLPKWNDINCITKLSSRTFARALRRAAVPVPVLSNCRRLRRANFLTLILSRVVNRLRECPPQGLSS